MTLLRPKRLESAARPQAMAVRNWAPVKLAWRMPALAEISAADWDGSNHCS